MPPSGAFSVSPSQLDAALAYVDNQEEHHRVRSFQEEYREKEAGFAALKKRFGIGKELIQQYAHPYLYLNP